ncbi:ATP-dependent DNA helicase [Brevibacterium samyangense]|uniref:DNA 3'-5' helicase n=1 Tax=Brevibacterium samyangense TaxID=366888 RepID=A0ABP5EMR0_9MICO
MSHPIDAPDHVCRGEFRYCGRELARILDVPPPTIEQLEIIEAPLEPLVVIAGAGSGKTTVLALRVVWLVANRLVTADRILGLTFTRKAVGELNERIRRLLARFRAASGPAAASVATAAVGEEDTGEAGAALTGLDVPEVSTYNAYAAALVSEHGLAIGIEPDSEVLDEAASRALAAEVVSAATTAEIPPDVARSTIVESLLALAGEINDHLTDVPAVVRHIDDALLDLLRGPLPAALAKKMVRMRPKGPSGETLTGDDLRARKAELTAVLDHLVEEAGIDPDVRGVTDPEALCRLADHIAEHFGIEVFARLMTKRRIAVLAGRYLERKRVRGALDFSDQVAFAYAALRTDPDALALERSRWDVVLLDEYQDTSSSQTMLLALLFARENPVGADEGAEVFLGLPVMAVGDPRQAIYGWRGASADNITKFPLQFPRPDGSAARELGLRTSWRNDRSILTAANAVAAGLSDHDPSTELTERRIPGVPTPDGEVVLRTALGAPVEGFVTDEYAHMVEWLTRAAREGARSLAVLSRTRGEFGAVRTALEAGGFEVHVVGSTGLLDDPFVADLRAALVVVTDPTAGDHLMRLLSGRSLRLGAADVAALSRFARERTRVLDLPEGERLGLVEALDALLPVAAALTGRAEPGTEQLVAQWRASGLGRDATVRVLRLGRALRRLRRNLTTVPALVRDIVRELDIDAEISALDPTGEKVHRKALDEFLSLVSGFTARRPGAGPEEFLTWLTVMEERDALSGQETVTSEDVVTVMTVHASKGLEFDAVAIPGAFDGGFPTALRETQGWLTGGALPYPLRRDRAALVPFDLRNHDFTDHKELEEWVKGRRVPLEVHHRESERRLMYVAMTRARSFLWLGARAWRTAAQKDPKELSPFFVEARDALGRTEPEMPETPETGNPLRDVAGTSSPWPVPEDPEVLRTRAARLAILRDRRETSPPTLESLVTASPEPVIQVLAQRSLDLLEDAGVRPEELPGRISTTGLVDLWEDPAAFLARLRRPMPTGPNEAAALGTEFHAWVENHFGEAALGDLLEDEPGSRLSPGATAHLRTLQERFLASPFADRQPVAIEKSFELVLPVGEGSSQGEARALHVPGKIDAVFATANGLEVVDWKTGRTPPEEILATMTVQLSVYALALSRMPEYADAGEITGAFYFLGSDEVVRPPRLHSEEEIRARLG